MKYTDLNTWAEAVAQAIREKKGSSEKIKPINFPQEISALGTNNAIFDTLDSPSLKMLTTRIAKAIRTKCKCDSCKNNQLINPQDFPEHIGLLSAENFSWVIWRNDSHRAMHIDWYTYDVKNCTFPSGSRIVASGKIFAAQLPVGSYVHIRQYYTCDYLISPNCNVTGVDGNQDYYDSYTVLEFSVTKDPHFIQQADKYINICNESTFVVSVDSECIGAAEIPSKKCLVVTDLPKRWRGMYLYSNSEFDIKILDTVFTAGYRSWWHDGSGAYVIDLENTIENSIAFSGDSDLDIYIYPSNDISVTQHSVNAHSTHNGTVLVGECSCASCTNEQWIVDNSTNTNTSTFMISKYTKSFPAEWNVSSIEIKDSGGNVISAEVHVAGSKTQQFTYTSIPVIARETHPEGFPGHNHDKLTEVFDSSTYSELVISTCCDGCGAVTGTTGSSVCEYGQCTSCEVNDENCCESEGSSCDSQNPGCDSQNPGCDGQNTDCECDSQCTCQNGESECSWNYECQQACGQTACPIMSEGSSSVPY